MKKKILLSFFSLLSFLGYTQGLPLEGFEGAFPPANWSVFDINVGGNTNWSNTPTSCQGGLAAYMNRQNIAINVSSAEYLSTPSVLVPANGELRFFSRSFTAGNQATSYEVRLAPGTATQNDPNSYTTLLASYTEDQLSAVFNVCDEHVINLSAYAGTNVYIAFVMKYTQPSAGLTGDRWILDNVSVIEKCIDPTALAAAPQATTATLNWTGAGASFEIENLVGTTPPTGIATGTSATNSFNQTGLSPNTNYCYYVRAVCSDSSSAWVGPFCYTTTTLPPVCGGNYVDAGGTTANYPNSSNETITICPDVPGNVVTVTFTSFNTEANWDGMYIHNGNSVSAPLFASNNGPGNGGLTVAGAYWGTANPGTFTSTSPDGCLTFHFISDTIINNPGWIANITCALPPTCPNPSGLSLSGTISTSTNATWTSNSTATTFNMIALPCGSPAPDESTTGYLISTTNTNALISGLNPDTCYDIYVRDECGPNDFSIWIGVSNISTQPTPPACGGIFTDPAGSNANYLNNTNYTVTICPEVSGEVVTVTFTSFDTESNWDGLYVYNGNAVSAPNLIPSGNGAGFGPLTIPGAYWGTTIPGPFTSSTPDGCLTFRFLSDTSFTETGWIANVTCGLPPTCPTPTALTSSTITSDSVNVTWTSNSSATLYNIIALPCGSPAPDDTTTGYLTSSTNIDALVSGLDADTCYDIYVRDECGSADFSLWIGPETITTQIEPPVCGSLFTDLGGVSNNYTSNTNYTVTICPVNSGDIVTVTFTSFDTESNWDGLYVYDGNTVGVNQIPSTNGSGNGPLTQPGAYWGTTLPGPFSSTTVDGCLTFNFLSDTSFNNTGWIANVTCGPPPTCSKPNTLTNANVGLTSADFSWNQPQNPDGSTATNWEVLILPAGSPVPTATSTGWIATSNNAPFNATGLTQATCYDYYVRAACSPTDSSLWAGPSSFCTLIPNDECSGAIEVTPNPDQSCANFSNGSLIGATPSSQSSSCSDGDDVWFQFTATATNHSIDLNNVAGGFEFNLGYAVYSGTCGNLTELTCINDTTGTIGSLVIGQTYYVQVILDSFATGNYTFEVCVGTVPPPITTNDTQYTNVQLVEDVLFNSTCASVTNVTTSTGINFNSSNGIGYFNRNGSSFPFEDGVVLATRDINDVPGPNNLNAAFGSWPGDAQLFNYIDGLGIDPLLADYNDASILEFDFIPLIDNISFDFIFASEEYGFYQCDFSDAFAFFLTNNTTGVTTNLAIVPNTNDPISVITIRDNQFNGDCQSANPEYFADYYLEDEIGGLSPLAAPINFNGSTIPMTASSAVVPGQQYHIKLVVADRNDSSLDSAVFLEGGSFNFGLELGIDFLISTGNALCAGNTNQLTSDLDPNQYSFVWSNQNGVIPNETGPNLLINQSGTYTLTATLNNTQCSATDTITVEYYDPITLATPNNLTNCNSSGFAQFTLSNNNASVLGSYPAAQHTVTYHLTLADAVAGVNPLPNLYTNVTQFTQTIYARVTNVAGCFGTSQFDLIVQDLTPVFTLTPNFSICSGSSGTITVTPNNFNLNDVTYSWTLNNAPYGGNTSSITVSQAGDYTVTVNNSGCTSSATTTITVNVCEINIYASAVWMEDCLTPNDGEFFNTSGNGADLINQNGNTFVTNYGVHLQNSSTLVMRGAEIKTQKSGSSNVCDARMNYRIFLTGNTPGTFTAWDLPFYSDCNTGTGNFINGGGPCTTGQQKWQCVSQPGCTAPIDLTTLAPGNYTIQVYYDINGSFSTSSGCSDNLTLDNGGNYYVANFTIQASASIVSSDPITCNGNNGSITIGNLVPAQTYSVSYTDDSVLVGPTNIVANTNGEIIFNGLNAGTYTDFTLIINGCATALASNITLVDPGLPIVTVNNPVICSGASTTVTATPAVAGNYNYAWTVPVGATDPGNVASFTTNIPGDYTVVITPTNTLCNLDFETPTATGQFPNMVNENLVPCWETSAPDGIMEFWPSPNYENVLAYQGSQFIEMNGNSPDTIFQDFTITPGATLNISFAHRGRQGNDTVGVEIGPTGGPYVSLGSFTDGNTAWGFHTLNYLIPTTNGSNYTIRFVAISSANGSATIGNFLDAISLSTIECSSTPTTGTVSLLPNVTLALTNGSNAQSICFNTPIQNIVYTSVNATDITVSGLPSGVTGVFNAGEFTISGTASQVGTFNYTVSTVGGCNTETLSGTITVSPDSTLTLTSGNNSQQVCINTPIVNITYTATDASDVTVSGLPNGVTATFATGVLTISGTPTQAGTFTYSATTVSTCATSTLTGSITVSPDVTLVLTSGSDNQSVCINSAIGTITYTATDATNVTVTGLPNGVTGNYNAGVFSISGTPTQSGTFNFTVSTTSNCGSASLTGSITVSPNVTLSLSSGITNQSVCINTAISSIVYQSANGATGITVSGLPNGVTGTLAGDVLTISGTPTVSGTFNYTVTTVGGCSSASLTGTITVNPLVTPTFNFGTSLVLCPGATPPTLPTLSSNAVNGTWSPSTISTSQNGVYTFTPNAGECASPATLTVTLESAFSFEIEGACQGNAFVLQAIPVINSFDENTSTYSWAINGIPVGSDADFNVTAHLASTNEELPITISLTITTTEGCSSSDSYVITRAFCEIQNGISPNGDGKNDFFDLRLLNVSNLNIYNRYGTTVYSKPSYKDEWIGQSDKGEELPDGTYFYVIEFNDNQEAKTGWIYINRQKQ